MDLALLDNYGVMGFFVACLITAVVYLVKRDEKRDEKLGVIIENNTIAVTKFVEMTKACQVKK